MRGKKEEGSFKSHQHVIAIIFTWPITIILAWLKHSVAISFESHGQQAHINKADTYENFKKKGRAKKTI